MVKPLTATPWTENQVTIQRMVTHYICVPDCTTTTITGSQSHKQVFVPCQDGTIRARYSETQDRYPLDRTQLKVGGLSSVTQMNAYMMKGLSKGSYTVILGDIGVIGRIFFFIPSLCLEYGNKPSITMKHTTGFNDKLKLYIISASQQDPQY